MELTNIGLTNMENFNFDEIDFVSSDHHFGHANIIKFCERPFSSVNEMNELLIYHWNETVSPSDTVLYLGDLAMGLREVSIPLSKRLNGRKLFLAGNHDVISSVYKASPANKASSLSLLEESGWEILPEVLKGFRNGVRLNASHYPYRGSEGERERYSEARLVDSGEALLHGHTHQKDVIRGNMFHVGVDSHEFRPVSMTAVDEWLKRGFGSF